MSMELKKEQEGRIILARNPSQALWPSSTLPMMGIRDLADDQEPESVALPAG